MAHDVFISHSTQDKAVSDAVCAALENADIRCWIAPRDVQPGRSFAGEITRAIQNSKAMVLIFSAHSNNSEQVLREVQLAVNAHLHIVQFRIEDVILNDDLAYFLSTPHWLDALTPPLENHLERLKIAIKALLDAPPEQSVTTAAATETQTAAPVAQRFGSASSSSQKRAVPAHSPQKPEVSTPGRALRPPVNRGREFVFAGAIVALLVAGAFGAWWFGVEQPRREAERQRQLTEQNDQRDNDATRQREIAEQERLAARPRAKEEKAKKKEDSLKAVAAATKEQPYVNSLGMKFVPVPGTGVLFSIWETRVKDFEAFVEATGHKATGGMYSLEKGGWKQAGKTWKDPGFAQTGEHAVCGTNWDDATAFCEWLTQQERKAGRISAKQSYRLPTDVEWSAAVGLKGESGSTPEARSMKVQGVYPWGTTWPPPKGAGNYDSSLKVDDFAQTSPAGSFAANENGIYDLGGNVWEWCEDWYDAGKKFRVLRGVSWSNYGPVYLLFSCRRSNAPEHRADHNGFRCVLVVESSR